LDRRIAEHDATEAARQAEEMERLKRDVKDGGGGVEINLSKAGENETEEAQLEDLQQFLAEKR